MRDRTTIAIVGAGLAAVAVILVIIVTAIQPIPDFAPLAGSGETGYVAYPRDTGERPGSVRIVDLADGETHDVDMGNGELAGWDDDGNLVVAEWGPTAERFLVVDPITGEQVGTMDPTESAELFAEDPVWIDHRDGAMVLERDVDGLTAAFAAPESYDVVSASAMGDDRIVFIDELGRVAVVTVGEDAVPVLVAEDGLAGWRIAGRP